MSVYKARFSGMDNEMVEWWSYDPDEARSTCETLVMCFVRFYTVSVHCAANVKITRAIFVEERRPSEGMGASTYRMASCS